MNDIQRLDPQVTVLSNGYMFVKMKPESDGAYVSYAMHKQEIESLQARLKALESTQKHQISVPSWAIEEIARKIVNEAREHDSKEESKYNGDPCHNTVDAIVSEISALDRKVAVCYYVGGNGFVNGGEYEYEEGECETGSKPRVIHITQDDFASGLKGDYRWRALKVGNVINANGELVDAYATLNINGVVVAQFYIK